MDTETKKKLLFFVTGSERAPIGGLAQLDFVISKIEGDKEQVPTSHTCFNILAFPEYRLDKLMDKLQLSLSNIEGFGLV